MISVIKNMISNKSTKYTRNSHPFHVVETFAGLWNTNDSLYHYPIAREGALQYSPNDFRGVREEQSEWLLRRLTILLS